MTIISIFDQTLIHPFFLYSIEYLVGLAFLYSAIRAFGKTGLLLFIVLSIQITNIQVLKATDIFNTPMALGTVLFTLTYMATDLLADVYGKRFALKGIWSGFFGMLMISFFMIITLMYPVPKDNYFYDNHQAMVHLFSPTPAIMIASFIAYFVSQSLEVTVFIKLKEKFPSRNMYSRFFISTALSILIDNIIFSSLAWYCFNPHPLPWSVIWLTYIWDAYILRLVLTVINLLFVQHFRNLLN